MYVDELADRIRPIIAESDFSLIDRDESIREHCWSDHIEQVALQDNQDPNAAIVIEVCPEDEVDAFTNINISWPMQMGREPLMKQFMSVDLEINLINWLNQTREDYL